MKTRCWIGIDNGVSGNIGIIQKGKLNCYYSFPMPVKRELNYTKTKQWLNRVDIERLKQILTPYQGTIVKLLIERPMINPTRFKASVSAIRALEATLVVLEVLKIPFEYVDSKQWQKVLLPSGLKKEELKEASFDIACRLFPAISDKLKRDGDGILIAEFARRTNKL